MSSGFHSRYPVRILESSEELAAVEDLQRLVWPGNETDIVPVHLLLAAVHNGGLVIGAYDAVSSSSAGSKAEEQPTPMSDRVIPTHTTLVGFAFGFPGLYATPDGPRLKHCSHMLGVHPDYRDQGIGFTLKRAQWQMVRHQGLDRITWTYDPLLSRNAHLNIARLGGVCNLYIREAYGQMRDQLNIGLPSDRFQVDWWVNSQRVYRRLSRKPRLRLDLAHFLAAETAILNATHIKEDEFPHPPEGAAWNSLEVEGAHHQPALILVEIPADFHSLKTIHPALALEWRLHTRTIFESAFERGYLVTDFIHLPGAYPRSFYVLSHGESTL